MSKQQTRDKYLAAGKCADCGAEQDPRGRYCTTHLEHRRQYARDAYNRKQGKTPVDTPMPATPSGIVRWTFDEWKIICDHALNKLRILGHHEGTATVSTTVRKFLQEGQMALSENRRKDSNGFGYTTPDVFLRWCAENRVEVNGSSITIVTKPYRKVERVAKFEEMSKPLFGVRLGDVLEHALGMEKEALVPVTVDEARAEERAEATAKYEATIPRINAEVAEAAKAGAFKTPEPTHSEQVTEHLKQIDKAYTEAENEVLEDRARKVYNELAEARTTATTPAADELEDKLINALALLSGALHDLRLYKGELAFRDECLTEREAAVALREQTCNHVAPAANADFTELYMKVCEIEERLKPNLLGPAPINPPKIELVKPPAPALPKMVLVGPLPRQLNEIANYWQGKVDVLPHVWHPEHSKGNIPKCDFVILNTRFVTHSKEDRVQAMAESVGAKFYRVTGGNSSINQCIANILSGNKVSGFRGGQ